MTQNEKYVFFWNGPFSNWFKVDFIIDGIKFNCTEQHMMYNKAMLFGDFQTAKEILACKNPRDHKALGRKVKNFDVELWNANAKQIVYAGNEAKFKQNPDLREVLFFTGDKILVEASPYDTIWGIGLGEEEAVRLTEADWKGTNWLGEVLTDLKRNMLRELG